MKRDISQKISVNLNNKYMRQLTENLHLTFEFYVIIKME